MFSAKVMILGAAGVGKTALAKRFAFDRFEPAYRPTVGVSILGRDVALGTDGASLRLNLWDTDGDFGSYARVSGVAGAMIVVDASRPETLVRAGELLKAFSERCPGRPVRIVVNKTDLPGGQVDVGEELQSPLFACASNGAGVADAFRAMAEDIWRRGLAH